MGGSNSQIQRIPPATTKGDLIVATAPGIYDTLTGGAEAQELYRSNSTPTGWTWAVDTEVGIVPDATPGSKGLIQLAGDLGGTAATPTVPGLAGKLSTSLVDAKADLLVASAPDTITRLPVGLNGAALLVDSATDTGLRWGYTQDSFTPSALLSGESTISRIQVTSNAITVASGELVLTYFTAARTETITQVAMGTGSTGTTGTPSVIRVGIYAVDGSGNLALEASTPHDATLLAAIDTRYAKALSASWSKSRGNRYAVGLLQINTGQVAKLSGRQLATVIGQFVGPPTISARISGQATLPATIAAAALTSGPRMVYFEMLP